MVGGSVVAAPDVLAKEPVLHLQCRIDLSVIWLLSNVDRWTCSSWLHLPCQNTFQPLHEPAVDRLIIRKMNLSQVDVLAVLHGDVG